MNAVMISCVQRADTERAQTLAELKAVGIEPVVTESRCDPAGPSLNRHAAWRALRDVEGPVLFVEDDITPMDCIGDAIALARELDVLLDFNLKRRRLMDGAEAIGGLGRFTAFRLPRGNVEARRGWYGTQCVYMPERAVRLVQERFTDLVKPCGCPKPAEFGFDFWLKEHAESLGGMHALDPPPVRHRHPISMRLVTAPSGASL